MDVMNYGILEDWKIGILGLFTLYLIINNLGYFRRERQKKQKHRL
jgi:hypothetical protein